MEKLGVSTLAKLCIIACASLQVQIWFVLAVKYADMNYVLQLVQQLCRINLVEFLCFSVWLFYKVVKTDQPGRTFAF